MKALILSTILLVGMSVVGSAQTSPSTTTTTTTTQSQSSTHMAGGTKHHKKHHKHHKHGKGSAAMRDKKEDRMEMNNGTMNDSTHH